MIGTFVITATLQFQIIVSPRLLVFGFFVGAPSYLDPLPRLINFQIFFVDISETVKTDRSFYETASSLVYIVLIS